MPADPGATSLPMDRDAVLVYKTVEVSKLSLLTFAMVLILGVWVLDLLEELGRKPV